MEPIQKLQTVAEWESSKHNIPEQGLLIFKFSPRCPISRGVERDFDDWYEQLNGEQAFRCVKVDVVNARELSRHIAREVSVTHESPQAIWLTPTQKVYWHASHRSISKNALNATLEDIT